MNIQTFETKFNAAVESAKKSKASGTQISVRLFLANGETVIITQTGGSFFKFNIDKETGTLQIGDRTTIEMMNNQSFKNVNYIDIQSIIGFSTEYITNPES